MALKFDTNASLQRFKSVVASEESLVESIDDVASATEALLEAQVDGAEICQVLDNLSIAYESLKNGGLTANVLGVFNSEGELSKCVGQENLTVAGLEALGDHQIKALSAKYVEGLEGKMAEYWNKFVAWLKNLWVKIVNWFKNILVNRARYVKALEAVKSMTDFDGSAKVTTKGLWKTGINKKTVEFSNELARLAGVVATAVSTKDPEKADALLAGLKKAKEYSGLEKILSAEATETTVSKMFTSLGQFKGTVAVYIKEAKSDNFAKVTKNIDNGFRSLVTKAGEAGHLEGKEASEAKAWVNGQRDLLVAALEAIRLYNKAVMAQGAELLKIYKAANKAPKAK